MLSAHGNWSGAKAIACENGAHTSAFLEVNEEQIVAIGLADARLGDTERDARNRVQRRRLRRAEIHGHPSTG
jgi:hypothetical protein